VGAADPAGRVKPTLTVNICPAGTDPPGKSVTAVIDWLNLATLTLAETGPDAVKFASPP
jgi:hypothetical protein